MVFKDKKVSTGEQRPDFTEKRKHPRINTENLLKYILYDEKGNKIEEGKGRTLNLSQGGALLETPKPLRGSIVILVTIDLDGKKIQVEARVANTRKSNKDGYYLTGVEFIGPREEQLNAIVAFVKAYTRHKHSRKT